jgi:chromosome segregation ATPase
MQISGLTISGFKSFGKKSDFSFRSPITAIVGPNGSGKSNITEAVRFVLGEQSFKSMRTKEVTDLLFRGAEMKVNQLSVSVQFTGTANLVGDTDSLILKNALEQDSVEIARYVYADGRSLYKINNNEVRLKDVQELIQVLSLGNKSSWHISQGESDRILLATVEERRVMIEDALGLKIYHNKIADSLKKLERSKANIKEAELKRREMAPELSTLSKQIERIEKVKVYKEDILRIFTSYYIYKEKEIERLAASVTATGSLEDLNKKRSTLMEEIRNKEIALNSKRSQDTSGLEMEYSQEEKVLSNLKEKLRTEERRHQDLESRSSYARVEKDRLLKELTEVMADLEKLSGEDSEFLFKKADVAGFRTEVGSAIQTGSLSNLGEVIEKIVRSLEDFLEKGVEVSKDSVKESAYLQGIKLRLEKRLTEIVEEEKVLVANSQESTQPLEQVRLQIEIVEANLKRIFAEITEFKLRGSELENAIERAKGSFKDLENDIERVNRLHYVLQEEERKLDQAHYELKRVFGSSFSILPSVEMARPTFATSEAKTSSELADMERQVERLKLKIEDSTIGDVETVQQQFEDMSARDTFLVHEIEDLNKSIFNLEQLILDLQSKLKADFEDGVQQINQHFNQYVQQLFGGGAGSIKVLEVAKRKKKAKAGEDTDELEEEIEEGEEEMKTGVEVEVDLPKKKVKGLHSLSGGERALVSIALTVAILNNNPSPFMILDEADATLDEANAKRYGELLTLMKEKTKLIVVTHNRETMSFANEVYGITLEKGGASKVLSVSFEDALSYTK